VEREGVIRGLESAWKRKDGTTIYIRESAKCVRDENGRVLYYEGTVEDISERIQAEDKVRQKINQLTALRKIDTTIASSTDLQLCLNTILNETKRLLEVDATDILLFDPHMYRLEFAAGLGFYTRNVEKISMRLGESLAGKAALDQKRLEMHRINDKEKNRLSHLKGEKITCYHAVPLIVKGKIKGVLEVYLRKHAQHTPEWGDFLETLAGQAAIAIDNSQMFDGLQQSNFEMTMAYDQVIEGWAQALDLREKETGNHAKRVTEMTVKLASAMGFKDKDLLHIRYGALLHDIGKMGVPDHILLKPGKLTESEWAVVRQHPQYAYNLLNQIPYLQPSLDIPYAHHEKWDGSGYPLGLEGENIPFQARIFAVVDVYDALISDKPYRNKWPKQKALDYIEDQSGKHFDPDVVKVFLREFRSELLR
jgi:putative nucleotidyltransferase with HDIG domain